MRSICKVADCTNIVGTKGYCGKHWLRLKRNGNVNKVQKIARYNINDICVIDKCSNKPLAKNLCNIHYLRERKKSKGLCTQNACIKLQKSKGLCSYHYDKLRTPNGAICIIDKCKKNIKVIKYGYCNQHYIMFKLHGDPLAGAFRIPHRKALDHGDGTRTCTKCSKRLSIKQFHRDKTATGGVRATCKKCRIRHVTNWYSNNRERQAGREKKRRLSNPEKYAEAEVQRYKRDRVKRIALATEHSHLRRARRKNTKTERGISKLALKKKFGTKCYYCNKEMDFSVGVGKIFNRDMATIEHLIPLAKGGEHTFKNTVLACRHCNISKNAKSEEEFEDFKS